jgi:ribose 5-phosphate isomerase B
MKIAIASDHAAFALKTELVEWLAGLGHEVADLGTDGEASVDYPDFGYKLAEHLAAGASSAESRCAAAASALRSPPTAIRRCVARRWPSRYPRAWPARTTTPTPSRSVHG